MNLNVIHNEDCLSGLKKLPDNSIDCCVTSPPYYGLRDYGVDGQIGLEETPEQYVAKMVEVFREVRRVLKDDGTLWLNLGDSYASGPRNRTPEQAIANTTLGGSTLSQLASLKQINKITGDLKPKDLIGIPWLVAKSLQASQYNGLIKQKHDRSWMAAIIDGEGTICGFDHLRKDDGRIRTGINICVTNSNVKLLDRCHEVYPASRSEHNVHGDGHLGNLPTYRWIVHGTENKIQFIKEIYPHLIAKRDQALLAYNLLLFQTESKRLGKTPMKNEVNEKRRLLVSLISKLNNAELVDIPDWCVSVEPETLYSDGWYLRQEITWAKKNCMPESVRDRCTRSHENIFMLSKSANYYYDQKAIMEPAIYDVDGTGTSARKAAQKEGNKLQPTEHTNGIRAGLKDARLMNGKHQDKQRGHSRRHDGFNDRWDKMTKEEQCTGMRNRRDVWFISPAQFPEAHFATLPEEIPAICIKAGCPVDGVVLDPFMGAGTTGLVARKLNRNFIGFELNPDYIKIAEKRIIQTLGMFA